MITDISIFGTEERRSGCISTFCFSEVIARSMIKDLLRRLLLCLSRSVTLNKVITNQQIVKLRNYSEYIPNEAIICVNM